MKQWLPRAWYGNARWLGLLHPLSLLYGKLSANRREAYLRGRSASYRAGVPVVVIGNVTAGGTGKTPLTLALCKHLQSQGWHCAIVSRGYGGRSEHYPLLVTQLTPSAVSGDEAQLLVSNTNAPVVVDPDRGRAVRFLESTLRPDVILCDDGLQHYALARDIEIAVVDGTRGFGNGRLLPAGPMREPVTRLTEVDFIVINYSAGQSVQLPAKAAPCTRMQLVADSVKNLANDEDIGIDAFQQRYRTAQHQVDAKVHAVAGIGNPMRFFSTLQQAGFAIIAHAFPDHHDFRPGDIAFNDGLPVVMTEKDAVKCKSFANEQHWYLRIHAQLEDAFLQEFTRRVAACSRLPVANRSA